MTTPTPSEPLELRGLFTTDMRRDADEPLRSLGFKESVNLWVQRNMNFVNYIASHPEALPALLDRLEAQASTIEALEKGLEPFARALEDWGDDAKEPDHWQAWEHPVAMNVTLGDFRAAHRLLRDGKVGG